MVVIANDFVCGDAMNQRKAWLEREERPLAEVGGVTRIIIHIHIIIITTSDIIIIIIANIVIVVIVIFINSIVVMLSFHGRRRRHRQQLAHTTSTIANATKANAAIATRRIQFNRLWTQRLSIDQWAIGAFVGVVRECL